MTEGIVGGVFRSQHPASEDWYKRVTLLVRCGASVEGRGEQACLWGRVDWVAAGSVGLLAALLAQNAGDPPSPNHPLLLPLPLFPRL